jgi:hypothetical protein
VGGLNQSLPVTYSNNTNAGIATASASFAGDANHTASSGSATFTITPANATISVTPYNVYYDGNSHTATGTATGVLGEALSGLNLAATTHSAVGIYNDTWTFIDAAGNYNSTSGTIVDTIKSWTATGFYPPVSMSITSTPVWNEVKGGSTVPLKFNIYAGSVEQTSIAAVKGGTVYVWSVACNSAGAVSYITDYLTDTGATALRYDTTGGQFIQNWKTPKGSGACFVAIMTAADSVTTLQAYFKTK